MAKHPKMVGIGETGLDYHYTADSKDIQQKSLRIHCAAAAEAGLPLIIHARAADDDMARILAEEHRNAPFGCVMHCFSSSRELAEAALDLGFYLSMSGIGTFPKSQEIRDIFASAPVERILVETDAPYLAPPPFRGKQNEPSYVVHTAKVAADVYGLSYEDLAAPCERNFERLFTKAVFACARSCALPYWAAALRGASHALVAIGAIVTQKTRRTADAAAPCLLNVLERRVSRGF